MFIGNIKAYVFTLQVNLLPPPPATAGGQSGNFFTFFLIYGIVNPKID
jgi:hypothetical protein